MIILSGVYFIVASGVAGYFASEVKHESLTPLRLVVASVLAGLFWPAWLAGNAIDRLCS